MSELALTYKMEVEQILNENLKWPALEDEWFQFLFLWGQ